MLLVPAYDELWTYEYSAFIPLYPGVERYMFAYFGDNSVYSRDTTVCGVIQLVNFVYTDTIKS